MFFSKKNCLSSLQYIHVEPISSVTLKNFGAVVVVIAWLLHLQLPVFSVHITTNVVSSDPVHSEVYSIQHYVIKFVSDL
jgi:hypothetical protein